MYHGASRMFTHTYDDKLVVLTLCIFSVHDSNESLLQVLKNNRLMKIIQFKNILKF